MKHNATQAKCIANAIRTLCECASRQAAIRVLARLANQPVDDKADKLALDELERVVGNMLQDINHVEEKRTLLHNVTEAPKDGCDCEICEAVRG